jgi:hypothetical protein
MTLLAAGLTPGGWLIMFLSIGCVTTLFGWCLYRVLSGPRSAAGHLHGMNIETPDVRPAPAPTRAPEQGDGTDPSI